MVAQFAQHGLGGRRAATLGLGKQLQRALEGDGVRVVALVGLQAAEVAGVHDVGAEAADGGHHRFARLGVPPQFARKRQQLHRLRDGEVLARDALGQARAARLGLALGGSELDVRPDGPVEDEDRQARLGVVADGDAGVGLGAQDLHGALHRHLVGRGVGGHRGGVAVAAGSALEEGADLAHAHGDRVAGLGVVAQPDRGELDLRQLVLDAPLEAVAEVAAAAEEGAQEVHPVHGAVGDVVQRVLHAGGEADVHVVAEMAAQEVGDGHAHEGWHEGVALLGHVVALLDGGDDGGVGAGAADPLLLQLLDQRGLGVARRRGGLVARRQGLRVHEGGGAGRGAGDLLPLVHGRQHGVALSAVHDLQETVETHHGSGGAEDALAGGDVGGGAGDARVGHLRGDGAPPDQLVERELVAVEHAAQLVGGAVDVGRADGLVGFLRRLALGLVAARPVVIVVPETRADQVAHLVDGLFAQRLAVGPHVGDETLALAVAQVHALVQLLRHAHGALDGHAEHGTGGLLQGGRGEGRVGALGDVLLLHGHHAPRVGGECRLRHGAGLVLVAQPEDVGGLVLLGKPGRRVEVLAGGHAPAAVGGQGGLELGVALAQRGFHVEVDAPAEGHPLLLALHHEAQGHALHAPGA